MTRKERNCHRCGTPCIEVCPTCLDEFHKRKPVGQMSPDERANEVLSFNNPPRIQRLYLAIRLMELVGRPVQQGEWENLEGLARSAGRSKTIISCSLR
jgi:ferredoxin